MATKKTIASKTVKKAVSKTPAKKAVSTSKKTVAKKTVEKAAKKAIPVNKKTAVKKTIVKEKSTTKVPASPKKQENITQKISKKNISSTKKSIKKKPTIKEKVTTQKSSVPKKDTHSKVIKDKSTVSAKSIKDTKSNTTSSAKETGKQAAPVKRAIKKNVVAPAQPSARSEISDAVRQRPKKTQPKPGVVIAHRVIEKKVKKQDAQLTMEKYNPSTKSLLDQPEQSAGPVYRYSDEELNEFKELILKRLENARKELTYLQGLITRKDEAGTEDTDNRFNHMEDGSGAMEREQLSQFAQRQIKFINNLENALVRIENKTYGICRVTGKLIDKARLRAVPHATLSIEAKEGRA